MTNGKLQQAINFAMAHETGWARSPDQSPWGVHQTDPAPWNRLFGPVHERGGVCGVIMQDGNVLAGFGDTGRADLTFSVAKTYLALLAGVAHEQGLLPDVHEAVGARLSGIGFDDDHNSAVTWHHLLQQTSEWTGECFGIPDQVDHYRQLEFAPPTGGTKGDRRPLHQPGSYWEYNDVRINQLSLALLHLFRRPLPDVFAEFIAGPAGASTDWAWRGYDNAWVNIDGKRMQSVPGGTHWGGGVSISASDQARIGQILLGRGYANGRQILAPEWIDAMSAPCPIAPFYGYLVWLNQAQRIFPSVPDTSYFALGAGGNYTFIQPQAKLVVVVRWLDDAHADQFFEQVLDALA
jgi:CubicO group peptidase (beta-lactamase class C family)